MFLYSKLRALATTYQKIIYHDKIPLMKGSYTRGPHV